MTLVISWYDLKWKSRYQIQSISCMVLSYIYWVSLYYPHRIGVVLIIISIGLMNNNCKNVKRYSWMRFCGSDSLVHQPFNSCLFLKKQLLVSWAGPAIIMQSRSKNNSRLVLETWVTTQTPSKRGVIRYSARKKTKW